MKKNQLKLLDKLKWSISFVSLFLTITGAFHSNILGQTNSALTISKVRKVIADGNIRWGKARVEFDTLAFNEMLAPDFYVNIWCRNLTRQEFIKSISTLNPNMKLTRFDATVLTVQQKR